MIFLQQPPLLWRAWNWQPGLLLGILSAAALYLGGVAVCWRHAGYGRCIQPWRVVAFLGALVTIVVALLSPLDLLSSVLFSAHMVQHLLLLLVAPPLSVLARPLLAVLWVLPPQSRRSLSRWWRRLAWPEHLSGGLMLAPIVWLLHTAALWLWHMPFLYEAALFNDTIHAVEHLSFLSAAWLLWWTALEPAGGKRHYGLSVLIIFLTALQGGILGALLTFSATPWYPIYGPPTLRWGLSPLEDQQLAGAIMWVPSALVYLGAAAGLFTAWLAAVEEGMRRRERMVNASALVHLRTSIEGEV